MTKIQSLSNFCKNPKFILILLLAVFFLKGVFLATLHPIFDGQDEARHYTNVQYLAEPKEKTWEANKRPQKRDEDDFETYGFSEEIKKTATVANINILRSSSYNTIHFSNAYEGKNEAQINSKPWKPYNYSSRPEIAGGAKLYHRLASFIEKIFSNQSILVRFFLIRIFSVLLGTLAVFLAYLIIKNIGFSKNHTLLLTAIIAFQPKFSDYFTNINYDVLLISMFFLFTLGGILALKNGLNWKNLLLMITSAWIAYSAKGTGIILFAILALFLLYIFRGKIKNKNTNFLRPFYIFSIIAIAALSLYFQKYLPLEDGFLTALVSLGEYLDESLTMGRFALSARTYWGTLSWVNSWSLANAIDIIRIVETLSITGLIFYFVSKKRPDWLPEKKYVVFLIAMIVSLQLGIRTFDWTVFSETGSLNLGTPGRYFLPNLASHIILVFTGLGMFLNAFGQKKYFKAVLSSALVLMFSLSLYLIFDIIIYRFYL